MTTLPRQIAYAHCPVYEPGKGGGCKCGAPVTGQAHQEHVVEVTEAAVRELVAAEIETSIWDAARDGNPPSWMDAGDWMHSVNQGVAHAARIARGEVTP